MGIKTGIPQPSPFDVNVGSVLSLPHSNYTVGPQVEIRLPLDIGIEFDALYTKLPLKETEPAQLGQTSSASEWQFPVLVKGYLGKPKRHRSFIAAGPSFRNIWGIRSFVTEQTSTAGAIGITFASGSEFRLGAISICPEVRYTYWSTFGFANINNLGLSTRPSQTQFLVGVVF